MVNRKAPAGDPSPEIEFILRFRLVEILEREHANHDGRCRHCGSVVEGRVTWPCNIWQLCQAARRWEDEHGPLPRL